MQIINIYKLFYKLFSKHQKMLSNAKKGREQQDIKDGKYSKHCLAWRKNLCYLSTVIRIFI